ncbi:MAG TPA: undecaprenyl-diphosphate phosphatase [Streptosporangiaceae bacterium]|jgi:undecaprenyl-diphosphatase
MSHLTYAEALVVGLIQGVTEMFPVSSLGHNVLIPALIGGSWAQDLNVSKPESPYLAFIVGLHVATAVAMIIYFWRDWLRIVRGFISSLSRRRIETADERLAWMIVLATIPVGIAGLLLEHAFRVVFSRPIPTSLFLMVNGLILYGGERLRRRSLATRGAAQTLPAGRLADAAIPAAAVAGGPADVAGRADTAVGPTVAGSAGPGPAVAGSAGSDAPPEPPVSHPSGNRAARHEETAAGVAADGRIAANSFGRAVLIGSAQILALLPGISRDGVVTVTGMFRGLSREDAVRFSFLLSAPVILAAGVLKATDLTGPLGHGIHGQVLLGSLVSGIGAYLSVRFLVRYFQQARTLTPFAVYCFVAGLGSLLYLTFR